MVTRLNEMQLKLEKSSAHYRASVIITYQNGIIKTSFACYGDISLATHSSIVRPIILRHSEGFYVMCRLADLELKCKNNIIEEYKVLSVDEARAVRNAQPKKRKTYVNNTALRA